MTLREAYLEAARRLGDDEALRENAGRDAERLLRHALGLNGVALRAYPERLLSAEEAERAEALLQRRLGWEPMQYILGEQEFYGLPFRVTAATLIPRLETELLVEAVLRELAGLEAARIVDVGTGSGAIAVALARHLAEAQFMALDLSAEALGVAVENAKRNGVAERVEFRESDLLAALPAEFRADAVVSNPPYVPEADRAAMHPQVREFEPAIALFAGVDGLEVYRRLIPQALDVLEPGGLLAMEIGYGQGEAIARLLAGWREVRFLDDLQGISRVVLARRRG